ncbi:EamA family transporter [Curvibacter gracilis]|uniref:EamA family transporter n=1 Tax=Curvibacter gracilis TaxID=230310 RepID=UPI000484A4FD|nr:EamA family transporter [Curvibacter gracilis]
MSTSTAQHPWRDALLTALAPMIWGTTYLVTTEMLPPDRPFTAALLRALPAGLLLTAFCRRWPRPGDWGRLLLLSALNIGFFQALLFIAAYHLPGGLAAVAGALQPLLVMALAWLLDRQRPLPLALGAAGVGVLGMAALLLSPTASWNPVGLAAALAGTACMAAGTLLARRWRTDLPVLAFTGWQLLLGGLILAPLAWVIDPPLPSLGWTAGLGYAYLSLVGALLAYSLWFRGIARLPSVAVSSLGLLSPLTAVVLGWVWLGQAMTGWSLLGLVLVFGSILTVQWASAPKK